MRKLYFQRAFIYRSTPYSCPRPVQRNGTPSLGLTACFLAIGYSPVGLYTVIATGTLHSPKVRSVGKWLFSCDLANQLLE